MQRDCGVAWRLRCCTAWAVGEAQGAAARRAHTPLRLLPGPSPHQAALVPGHPIRHPFATCTSPLAGAALVAVYGFGVAAIWISLFATEIVGLLQFLGMVW